MLLTVALVLSGGSASAAAITEAQARAKAQSFLQSRHAVPGGRRLTPARTAGLLATPAGQSALYVFNIGEGDGFVVVSGDDRARPVLGYADSGTFEVGEIPAALREMLAIYARQIDMAAESAGSAARLQHRISGAVADVAPLLTTTWDQGAPYNNYCPLQDDNLTLTGCVATAMAQIANYHEHPKSRVPSLAAYVSATFGINVPAWGATTFDWTNMADSYDGTSTDAQRAAVATLMRYCGQAAQMDYGFTRSGTYNGNAYVAFTEKMGYSKSAEFKSAASYSADGWENLIYKEVSEGRPVYYSALNGDEGGARCGGHAFVIDGYRADGNYFHVNWGWGGACNGYFNLFALDSNAPETAPTATGWHYQMLAITGLVPETSPASAYKLSVSTPVNGTVSVGNSDCTPGVLTKITAVPADGYVVGSVVATDAAGHALPVTPVSNAANEYVFSFPKSNVTVTVGFTPGETEPVRFINGGLTLPSSWRSGNQPWTADTWMIWGDDFNENYDVIVGTPPTDAMWHQWYEEGYELTNSEADVLPNGNKIVWENHAASFRDGGNYDYYSETGAFENGGGDKTGDFYIRRIFTFNSPAHPAKLYLSCSYDDSPVEYYINGVLVYEDHKTASWHDDCYEVELTPQQIALIHTDGTPNVMAVHTSQNWGGYHLDCGLYDPTAISYEVRDDRSLAVQSNAFMEGEVVIPETVTYNGVTYTVKEVGWRAFSDCLSLTSVILPPSVDYVSDNVFQNCPNLQYVKSYTPVFQEHTLIAAPVNATEYELPMECTAIHRNAFKYATSLQTLTLQRQLTDIGEKAFAGCTSLKDIYAYARPVPRTAANAFEGLDKSKITVHVYASALDSYKQAWGTGFNYVTMPDPKLAELTVNVPTAGTLRQLIEEAAAAKGSTFYDVTGITVTGNINQDDLHTLAAMCDGVGSLATIDLSQATIEDNWIAGYMFAEKKKLTAITLPKTLNRIGEHAFEGCSNLTTVAGLEQLNDEEAYNVWDVFTGTALTEPLYAGKVFLFMPPTLTGEYVMPEGITMTTANSMRYASLTAITLPSTLTDLGDDTFRDCPFLTDISCLATAPPTCHSGVWEFGFDLSVCTIYVPASSVEDYKQADEWRDMRSIVPLGTEVPTEGPMNAADYAALCTIYNTLGGDDWYRKWNISDNMLRRTRWRGVTFDDEGYVTAIDLRENNLSGDATALTVSGLSRLERLDLSTNAITGDIRSLAASLPKGCELNIERQNLGYQGEHTLYEMARYGGLPAIAYYRPQSGTLATSLVGVGGHCQFYHEGTDNRLYWDSYIYSDGGTVNNLTFYWPSPVTVECLYPHRFTFTYTYEMGDANMDDVLNVLDLQATLNYSNNQGEGLFNFYAADTYGADNELNVQDIVTTVNILLGRGAGSRAAARALADGGRPAESEACVSVEDGQIVLYTARPVAAFELSLCGVTPGQLVWNTEAMGFATATAAQAGSTRAVVYSLLPRVISEGRTVLATFDPSLSPSVAEAVLSDSKAQPVSVGQGVPTGIRELGSEGSLIQAKLYDLQGRSVSGGQAKGVYIVNGKKVVVK